MYYVHVLTSTSMCTRNIFVYCKRVWEVSQYQCFSGTLCVVDCEHAKYHNIRLLPSFNFIYWASIKTLLNTLFWLRLSY